MLHKQQVRSAMRSAAIGAHLAKENAPMEWGDQLRQEIADQLALATAEGSHPTPREALQLRLRRIAIRAKREELIRLWRENEISDEVMRHHEEILDYQEA